MHLMYSYRKIKLDIIKNYKTKQRIFFIQFSTTWRFCKSKMLSAKWTNEKTAQ